jgi:hypothetical protein
MTDKKVQEYAVSLTDGAIKYYTADRCVEEGDWTLFKLENELVAKVQTKFVTSIEIREAKQAWHRRQLSNSE